MKRSKLMNKQYGKILFTTSLVLLLSGCGLFTKDNSMISFGAAPAATESVGGYYDDGFTTGGDYGNASIDGDQIDYSYSFAAGGDTNKNKDAMLADYETVQEAVTENGGFIDSVYNDYTYYADDDLKYNESARKYMAHGHLSFTVEIDNDKVPEIINLLEQLCQNNRFTVTGYTQRIQNYQNWKQVDRYDDDQYRYGEVITKEELDKRLKYADISVQLTYQIPRSKIAYLGLNIAAGLSEFWRSVKEIVLLFLALAVGLFVLFAQAILFYKGFVKVIWKNKRRHPEYYPPKDVKMVYNDAATNGDTL